MDAPLRVDRANTVLYCAQWSATVAFYRETIGLPVEFENEWFVEFRVAHAAMLSVADASRSTIAAVEGRGITLTWRVESVADTRSWLVARGVDVTPPAIRFDATVCYFHDPEGHRIELWAGDG